MDNKLDLILKKLDILIQNECFDKTEYKNIRNNYILCEYKNIRNNYIQKIYKIETKLNEINTSYITSGDSDIIKFLKLCIKNIKKLEIRDNIIVKCKRNSSLLYNIKLAHISVDWDDCYKEFELDFSIIRDYLKDNTNYNIDFS